MLTVKAIATRHATVIMAMTIERFILFVSVSRIAYEPTTTVEKIERRYVSLQICCSLALQYLHVAYIMKRLCSLTINHLIITKYSMAINLIGHKRFD